MGEVYRAHDERLGRDVAIKVLAADFAKDADRLKRFEQEARATSALNHPNILTVYDVGKHDGAPYIVAELLEGEELRAQLDNGALPVRKAVEYARQIAAALTAAHEAHITHRDIKPENVMVRRDGIVKVLDFGLAKLTEKHSGGEVDTESDTLAKVATDPGMVMGTPQYMSPEQARGQVVDARSDIFSLGVVLYEMIAGKPPFGGVNALEVISEILKSEPEPLKSHVAEIPSELQRIVSKALRKDRAERYQTARDLLTDLKDLEEELSFAAKQARGSQTERNDGVTVPAAAALTAGGTVTPTSSARIILGEIKRRRLGVVLVLALLLTAVAALTYFIFLARRHSGPLDSLAVLPFQNRSADADTEYLSDGLAESLIYRLSQLPNLKVSPTSSVFRYKDKDIDPIQVGSELGVQAVMSGRMTRRGDNLTISVELVDVLNRKTLWGEQYERKLSDLLATQREMATEITHRLQLKLPGAEQQGLTKRYTDNNEAYKLYLRGRFHFAKRTKDDILKGIEYFKQAITFDPNYALAHAAIANSYNAMPPYVYLSPKEAIPQAKAAATRALEIDPMLAEAHMAWANSLAVYDWNWVDAEREFKRALELTPNEPDSHWRYGMFYLMPVGRLDEAIAEVKRALELEPLSLNHAANLSMAYLYARQYDRALDQAKTASDLEPNFVLGRWALGQAYIVNGMYAEAIALSEKSLQADPTSQMMLLVAGYAYAKSGRLRDAEDVIKRFRDIARTQYAAPDLVAAIYVALGDKNRAFAELENGVATRDWWVHRMKVDPFMDPLRDDPRFKDLVRRIGLPE